MLLLSLRVSTPKESDREHTSTARSRLVVEAVATVAGQQHHIFELRAPDLTDAASPLSKDAGINANTATSSSAIGEKALTQCFGSLPLAISHAGAFAKQVHQNATQLEELER